MEISEQKDGQCLAQLRNVCVSHWACRVDPQGTPLRFVVLRMLPKDELQGPACLFCPVLLNKNSARTA